jgi:hypothetical protein
MRFFAAGIAGVTLYREGQRHREQRRAGMTAPALAPGARRSRKFESPSQAIVYSYMFAWRMASITAPA